MRSSKTPKSAFKLWLSDSRPFLEERFKNLSNEELSKKISEIWRTGLQPDVKKSYLEKEKELKDKGTMSSNFSFWILAKLRENGLFDEGMSVKENWKYLKEETKNWYKEEFVKYRANPVENIPNCSTSTESQLEHDDSENQYFHAENQQNGQFSENFETFNGTHGTESQYSYEDVNYQNSDSRIPTSSAQTSESFIFEIPTLSYRSAVRRLRFQDSEGFEMNSEDVPQDSRSQNQSRNLEIHQNYKISKNQDSGNFHENSEDVPHDSGIQNPNLRISENQEFENFPSNFENAPQDSGIQNQNFRISENQDSGTFEMGSEDVPQDSGLQNQNRNMQILQNSRISQNEDPGNIRNFGNRRNLENQNSRNFRISKNQYSENFYENFQDVPQNSSLQNQNRNIQIPQNSGISKNQGNRSFEMDSEDVTQYSGLQNQNWNFHNPQIREISKNQGSGNIQNFENRQNSEGRNQNPPNSKSRDYGNPGNWENQNPRNFRISRNQDSRTLEYSGNLENRNPQNFRIQDQNSRKLQLSRIRPITGSLPQNQTSKNSGNFQKNQEAPLQNLNPLLHYSAGSASRLLIQNSEETKKILKNLNSQNSGIQNFQKDSQLSQNSRRFQNQNQNFKIQNSRSFQKNYENQNLKFSESRLSQNFGNSEFQNQNLTSSKNFQESSSQNLSGNRQNSTLGKRKYVLKIVDCRENLLKRSGNFENVILKNQFSPKNQMPDLMPYGEDHNWTQNLAENLAENGPTGFSEFDNLESSEDSEDLFQEFFVVPESSGSLENAENVVLEKSENLEDSENPENLIQEFFVAPLESGQNDVEWDYGAPESSEFTSEDVEEDVEIQNPKPEIPYKRKYENWPVLSPSEKIFFDLPDGPRWL